MANRDVRFTNPDFFRHWVDDNVRFSDQDSAGHINNTAIAQYVESGRVAYMHALLPERKTGGRFVAASLNIDYLREAHYPGVIRTGTRVIRIGNGSAMVGFGVFKDGDCIASGNATVAYLDGAKTAPLPREIRVRMEADLAD